MSRRMKTVACVVAAIAFVAGMCELARADSITVSAVNAVTGTSTLSSGLTDWYLGSGNDKSGGTAISTTSATTWTDASYPKFTYTDGTSPVSATAEQGTFRWDGGNNGANVTIAVAAGSGVVQFWTGTATTSQGLGLAATLTADLSGTTGVDLSQSLATGMNEYVFDYSSSQGQNIVLTLTTGKDEGGNWTNSGFFAVSVAPIPEPSTLVLLASGLLGLLAYAWRKRR